MEPHIINIDGMNMTRADHISIFPDHVVRAQGFDPSFACFGYSCSPKAKGAVSFDIDGETMSLLPIEHDHQPPADVAYGIGNDRLNVYTHKDNHVYFGKRMLTWPLMTEWLTNALKNATDANIEYCNAYFMENDGFYTLHYSDESGNYLWEVHAADPFESDRAMRAITALETNPEFVTDLIKECANPIEVDISNYLKGLHDDVMRRIDAGVYHDEEHSTVLIVNLLSSDVIPEIAFDESGNSNKTNPVIC
ncbi:hypothetical protein [Neptuniibacter sp. QD37_11]|uniref:hypothetical protein n=1 Tax=Neptuniibacter sp. QD37_11 TaxID=3398209 RepID=UPI0039F5B6E2